MREIAFPIMLTAAALAMPVMEVLEQDPPLPRSQVEVLTNPIVMPSASEGEAFDIVFVAIHSLTVDAIQARLANAAPEALPTFLTSAPQAIQSVDASSGNLVSEVEVEFSPAANIVMASSSDLWEVSASVLNIRAGPSNRNPIVGTMTRGERAVVIGDTQSGWMPVRSAASNTEGWVYARHLAPLSGT